MVFFGADVGVTFNLHSAPMGGAHDMTPRGSLGG